MQRGRKEGIQSAVGDWTCASERWWWVRTLAWRSGSGECVLQVWEGAQDLASQSPCQGQSSWRERKGQNVGGQAEAPETRDRAQCPASDTQGTGKEARRLTLGCWWDPIREHPGGESGELESISPKKDCPQRSLLLVSESRTPFLSCQEGLRKGHGCCAPLPPRPCPRGCSLLLPAHLCAG